MAFMRQKNFLCAALIPYLIPARITSKMRRTSRRDFSPILGFTKSAPLTIKLWGHKGTEEAVLSSIRQVRFPDVVYYVTFGRSTKGPKHLSLSLILFIAAAENIHFIRALSTIEFFMAGMA
jgi:hypothetical protein